VTYASPFLRIAFRERNSRISYPTPPAFLLSVLKKRNIQASEQRAVSFAFGIVQFNTIMLAFAPIHGAFGFFFTTSRVLAETQKYRS
jgi:hypothetical protein